MVDYARDVRRLQFGCNVTRFTYLLCLCILKQADAQEEQLHSLAELLSKDTQSVMGYDKKINTALDASWLGDVYHKNFASKKKGDVDAGGMLI